MTVIIDLGSTMAMGQLIKFHRKQANLSRIELADIAGIGKTVVYDIEKGKTSVRFSTLLKVLSALNISLVFDSPLMARYEESIDAES